MLKKFDPLPSDSCLFYTLKSNNAENILIGRSFKNQHLGNVLYVCCKNYNPNIKEHVKQKT